MNIITFSKFRTSWKTADKYLYLPVLSSVITSVIILAIFFFYYAQLPARLPLYYSLSWGEAQMVSKLQFILLPISSIVIAVINLTVAYQLHSSQYILKRTLSLNLLLVNLLLLITSLKILSIFI
jgi:uncharacterized membrane protein